MAEQRIRIKLKAFDHRLLDQSAKDRKTHVEVEPGFRVLFRCLRNEACIQC